MKTSIEVPPVGRIARTQALILLVVVVGLAPLDAVTSFSVLIGGIIQIVPQAYFSLLAFRYVGARQAPKILRAIQKGETGKLLITALLFGLSFSFLSPLDIPVLFLTYCAMIIIQWFCAAKALKHTKK
jgi:ATP synthase protein I|tara:strand:- start:2269 stop:2652 length:384 start_codon:yes stop_codon:yes gene_type:complete